MAWVQDGEGRWVDPDTGEIADVGYLLTEMGKQDQIIEALVRRLTAVEKKYADKAGKKKPSRWSWQHLGGNPRTQQWLELRSFVDWLISRYNLTAGQDHYIAPCWYEHGAAVEELTALMAAWRSVYCDGDDPTEGLARWHTTWLWPTLSRLQKVGRWSSCVDHGHREPAPIALTDTAFAEHAADDTSTPDPDVTGDPLRPVPDADRDPRRALRSHQQHPLPSWRQAGQNGSRSPTSTASPAPNGAGH